MKHIKESDLPDLLSTLSELARPKEDGLFCYCWTCEKPIYNGEKMLSLTLSADISEGVVVSPQYAEGVATWCTDCTEKALEHVAQAHNLDHGIKSHFLKFMKK